MRAISGNRAWITQRISALYLALYLIAVLIAVIAYGLPADQAAWQTLLAQPSYNLATAGFIAALLLHAWVGGRDIILDYIHPTGLRLGLLSALAIFLILNALWAARILLLAQASTL